MQPVSVRETLNGEALIDKGLKAGETVVIHASPGWSRDAEDTDAETVAQELWAEVSTLLGLPAVTPKLITAHLWRHGLVDQHLGESFIYSTQHKVGVNGTIDAVATK